jgi:uncharacterized protein (TIGR00251 family)
MRLSVLVQPRASRNAIVGWHGEALKVALCAPPVDGEANAALLAFLAQALGLKKAQVRLVQGHSSRRKGVDLDLDEAAFRAALAPHLKP